MRSARSAVKRCMSRVGSTSRPGRLIPSRGPLLWLSGDGKLRAPRGPSLARARETGGRYDEGLALLEIGRRRRRSHAIERAVTVFERVGARAPVAAGARPRGSVPAAEADRAPAPAVHQRRPRFRYSPLCRPMSRPFGRWSIRHRPDAKEMTVALPRSSSATGCGCFRSAARHTTSRSSSRCRCRAASRFNQSTGRAHVQQRRGVMESHARLNDHPVSGNLSRSPQAWCRTKVRVASGTVRSTRLRFRMPRRVA